MNTAYRFAAAVRYPMLLNAALFQLGWWACILLAANGRPALALVALALIVSIHVLTRAAPMRALRLAAACVAIGALVESIMVSSHLIAYPPPATGWNGVPPWMIGLWALLSTTLGESLRWLSGHPLLGVAFGAAGGALAYDAGAHLGALRLLSPWSLWSVAAIWGAALPGLLMLARRWEDGR